MKPLTNTILLIFTLLSFNTFAQQPSIVWQKNFGGTAHEYANQTIQTGDGGYAFVGESESTNTDVTGNHGGNDLWVAKITSTGSVVWSFLFGGSEDDYGQGIVQTADGGFMAAGYSNSYDGDVTGNHGTYSSDIWVVKLSPAGALEWQHCYGGDSDEDGLALVHSNHGTFYLLGSTYSNNNGDVSGLHGTDTDCWLIEIDASGNLLRQKCLGGTDYDEGIQLAATTDGGCIITGRTDSYDGDVSNNHGGQDLWVARLDSTFQIEWESCYGGTETEEGNAVVQCADGSFGVLGYTSTHNNGDVTGHYGSQGMDDYWLLKLSAGGTLQWAKCFGGSGDDQANGLCTDTDGGFVMSGLTNSSDGQVTGFHTGMWSPDIWIAKVSSTGTLLWQKCFGGTDQDEAFDVFRTNSGHFLTTGFTYSNNYDVTSNYGSADGWLIEIAGTSGVGDSKIQLNVVVYPNPAKDLIYIDINNFITENLSIEILDLSGRILDTFGYQNSYSISNLSPGMYLMRLCTNEGFGVCRFEVIR
ncbi:MAG: T9SS type A sorting domain-containing protein [Bacteroidetes bacterium]|nr:T9SS type A sorting domain-containing protein [Bacteroidota bacterium]